MVGKSEPESKRPRHEAELSSLEDKQLEAKNQLQRGVRSSDTALEQGQHRFRQLDSQEAQALCSYFAAEVGQTRAEDRRAQRQLRIEGAETAGNGAKTVCSSEATRR